MARACSGACFAPQKLRNHDSVRIVPALQTCDLFRWSILPRLYRHVHIASTRQLWAFEHCDIDALVAHLKAITLHPCAHGTGSHYLDRPFTGDCDEHHNVDASPGSAALGVAVRKSLAAAGRRGPLMINTIHWATTATQQQMWPISLCVQNLTLEGKRADQDRLAVQRPQQ